MLTAAALTQNTLVARTPLSTTWEPAETPNAPLRSDRFVSHMH